MPIPVVCASCQTKLVAPDAAAGKRVKCKICQAAIVVPTPVVEEASDFAFGDPVNPVKAQPKTVKLDDDRPRKKSKVVVDDEDEIDPPRKRTKRKQVAKANPLKFVLLGLVGLMAVGVVGAVAWYATSRGTTNGTSPSKDALDGWTRFEKPGYTAYFKDSLGVPDAKDGIQAGVKVDSLATGAGQGSQNGMLIVTSQSKPADYEALKKNPANAFDASQAGMLLDGKILSKKDIAFEGNPGREIKVQKNDGSEAIIRSVLANGRLYIFVVIEPGITEQSETYKTFFDNIKLKP